MLMIGIVIILIVLCVTIISIVIIREHYENKRQESIHNHQKELLESKNIDIHTHDLLENQVKESILEDCRNKLNKSFSAKPKSIPLIASVVAFVKKLWP